MERARDKGENWFNEIRKKDKVKKKKKKDGEKIRKSKYNNKMVRMYKRRKGVLGYLRQGWGNSRWKRVVRFKIQE